MKDIVNAFLSRKSTPMPSKFETLAVYNAERARGLVHTEDWQARMVTLQAEFDEWAVDMMNRTARHTPMRHFTVRSSDARDVATAITRRVRG